MRQILLTTLIFICGVSIGNAQDFSLSGNYSNALFKDVVSEVEVLNPPLKFYYETEWDSIPVSLVLDEVSLQIFLDALSKSTALHFFVHNKNNVIVTSDFEIKPELPFYFFQGEEVQNDEGDDYYSILEGLRDADKNKAQESLETKLFEIGRMADRYNGSEATIEGYLKDVTTGEPLVGASVFIKKPVMGVVTDPFGYYSFTLPKGKHELFVNSVGMKPTKRQIQVYGDGKLDIELDNEILALKEVEVTGERDNVDQLQTGVAKLSMKNIKQIPTVMGEADIMKIALTLPGVQTVGEGASGFNVRGGGTDQNLILINDVPIYNTNHLFGFFSAFNPEVISSANLYKSGIQANYGGRISSVFDVALRDGNKRDFSVKGGISPITGKVTIEGPLKKDTSSFVLGVRSTYSDYIFSLLNDPNLRNSQASFSDFITKFNFKIDDKNTLVLSGYHSRDNFSLNSDSVYQYYNSNASIQWRHNFNNKLYLVTSGSYANYSYNLTSDEVAVNAFEMDYEINHTNFKSEVNYFPNSKNNLRMGITSTLYNLNPGQGRALGDSSLVTDVLLDRENGLESAIYFGNEFEVNPRLSIYAGIRLSMFNLIGPGKSYTYQQGSPLEPEFITDTLNYSKGEMIKTYAGPEYRFSARQKLNDDLSVKFSYDRTRQYIHMLSNSVSISPTDTWRLSNTHIRPQIGDQVSLGLYKTVFGKGIEISLEGYYKKIQNVLEYKDGASLLLNEVLETDVINSEGKAYGVEFMIKRDVGKVSGWLSYTYARSFVQANGAYPVEQINQGEFYPSNFDKPHNLVIISNYKFNRRVNLSLNINYSTGRPATFPASKYTFNNQPILLYTERNQYRVPDYFRMDLAVNFEGNHKVKKRVHGSWSFSVYNLTGRSNAYSVYFLSEGGNINGYQLSVFANPIPTITYNFHYR